MFKKVHRIKSTCEPFCVLTNCDGSGIMLMRMYYSSLYEYLEREKGIYITRVYEDIEAGYAHAPISSELQVVRAHGIAAENKDFSGSEWKTCRICSLLLPCKKI